MPSSSSGSLGTCVQDPKKSPQRASVELVYKGDEGEAGEHSLAPRRPLLSFSTGISLKPFIQAAYRLGRLFSF